MKNPTRAQLGSFGRDCVLVILCQHYGSKARIFEGNLFWVGHYWKRK